MASKRRLRKAFQKRSCTGKDGFSTELKANKVLVYGMQTFRLTPQHGVYKCQFCDKWHIGTQRPRKKKRAASDEESEKK